MSTKKLPKLKITTPVLPDLQSKLLPVVVSLAAFVGPTKSGKTRLAISLAKGLIDEGSATRIFLYCPTYKSNPLYSALIREKIDKVYTDVNKPFDVLRDVELECEADARIYADKLKIHIAYRRFTSGDPISAHDEALLEQNNWRDSTPIRPHPILVLDDLQGTSLYSVQKANPLLSLCLRHRHIGDGTGLSVWALCQSHKAIPRALRNSLSYLACFRTGNLKERESFYLESSQQLSFKEFDKLFEEYTAKPYSYLWINNTDMTISPTF